MFNGASVAECRQYSGNYQRNVSGCFARACNSAERLCFKCVEEGKRGTVLDPARGLCEEHQKLADAPRAAPKPAPQQQRLRIPTFALEDTRSDGVDRIRAAAKRIAEERARSQKERVDLSTPLERRDFAMAQSTPLEIERLGLLNRDEEFVLSQMAYGYDFKRVERRLVERPDRVSSDSVSDLLRSIYGKLEVADIPRESDRLKKAGKIYLDSQEEKRDRGVAADHDTVKKQNGADIRTTVAGGDDTPPDEPEKNERPDREDQPPEEAGMTSRDLEDALRTAAEFAAARKSGEELPPIREVYLAVKAMDAAGRTRVATGEAFGYSGNSAVTWAWSVSKLETVTDAAWKLIGDKSLPITFMTKVSRLDALEQKRVINERLNTPAEQPAPPAPKPHPAAAAESGKANGSNGAEAPHYNGHHAEQVIEPPTVAALVPVNGASNAIAMLGSTLTMVPLTSEQYEAGVKSGMFKSGAFVVMGPPDETGVSHARVVKFG